MKKKSKTEKKAKPDTPSNLDVIDIKVNAFGQIEKNFDVEQINLFLNENVPDKKLSGEEK